MEDHIPVQTIEIYNVHSRSLEDFQNITNKVEELFGGKVPQYISERFIKFVGPYRLLGSMFAPMWLKTFGFESDQYRYVADDIAEGAFWGRMWLCVYDDILDEPGKVPRIVDMQRERLIAMTWTVLSNPIDSKDLRDRFNTHFFMLMDSTIRAHELEILIRKDPGRFDIEHIPEIYGGKIALTTWIPLALIYAAYHEVEDIDNRIEQVIEFSHNLNCLIQLNHDLLDVADDFTHQQPTYPILIAENKLDPDSSDDEIYRYYYQSQFLLKVINKLQGYCNNCIKIGKKSFPDSPFMMHLELMNERYEKIKAMDIKSIDPREIRILLAMNQGHPQYHGIKI